jgi:sterol desaturase/sphingolipid hydroxylase (fatty acid hydroxylase superfamily)
LTLHALDSLPFAAKVVLALLFGDLVFWMTHFVRHKVLMFWKFHAVHHSQRELNFFSEYRVHPVDDMLVYTLAFIPLFMFGISGVAVLAIVWIRHWHTRLYHANIRSNFGPLRYLLVTPQSHRIHHSSRPEHQDKNFGLTFSLWDQLFGTQYRGWDEYPETGIEDEDFPLEQGRGLVGAAAVTLRQLVYPFQSLRRGGGAGRSRYLVTIFIGC